LDDSVCLVFINHPCPKIVLRVRLKALAGYWLGAGISYFKAGIP
jgi:hypothetical protein